jgi:spore maturation protein CgeB
LSGIPTIRVFEALACGIPLVSAPWDDCEQLFRLDQDFVMVRSGAEMAKALRDLKNDPELRMALARNGLETIMSRHTCAHRVDELISIVERLRTSVDERVLESAA